MFDEIIVLIAYNPNKVYLFNIEERMEMIREIFGETPGIRVDCYSGLLVDYLKMSGANIILRGMRALSDFEYEFQMALMNRRQTKHIETVFLMSGFKWFFTSSKLIKEVASLGGSVKGLVPDNVYQRLTENTIPGVSCAIISESRQNQSVGNLGDHGQSECFTGSGKRRHRFRRR